MKAGCRNYLLRSHQSGTFNLRLLCTSRGTGIHSDGRCTLDASTFQPISLWEFAGAALSCNLVPMPLYQRRKLRTVCSQSHLHRGVQFGIILQFFGDSLRGLRVCKNDVVVAGGMESMSNAPKYLVDATNGSRLGHDTIVDGMVKDGLWDVYNDFGMAICAEICADQHKITREQQDSYSIQSFECGISTQSNGAFAWEIIRGKPSALVDEDEGLGKGPGHYCNVMVLVRGKKAVELRLQVIAKIAGYGDATQAPELFTTTPALAIPKAISNAGLKASQIDYYEINEAFVEKVNVHGGPVSLGNPIGCSGACILVTLLGVYSWRLILSGRHQYLGAGGREHRVSREFGSLPKETFSNGVKSLLFFRPLEITVRKIEITIIPIRLNERSINMRSTLISYSRCENLIFKDSINLSFLSLRILHIYIYSWIEIKMVMWLSHEQGHIPKILITSSSIKILVPINDKSISFYENIESRSSTSVWGFVWLRKGCLSVWPRNPMGHNENVVSAWGCL
ncbi:hypothetical protein AAG906_000367 [Vitis piasezkii]